MKTFSEAADVVTPEVPAEQFADTLQSVQEMRTRYHAIALEIAANPKARAIVRFVAQSVTEGVMSTEHAILSTLINGVIIGIEMEKQEWPKSS